MQPAPVPKNISKQSSVASDDVTAFIVLISWCLISMAILLFAIASGLTTMRLLERVKKIDGNEEKNPQTIILNNYDISAGSLVLLFALILFSLEDTRPVLMTVPFLTGISVILGSLIIWGVLRRTVWKKYGPSNTK